MPTTQDQTVVPPLAATQETEPKSTDERPVNIPMDDFTVKVDQVDQHLVLARQALAAQQQEVQRLPQGRPNAFQGPTRFHDLPEKVAREIYDYAESENRARTITHDILASRQEDSVKPYTPPAVPTAIAEQTRLEMEAGRKTVALHAERAAHRPVQKQENTTMVPVFRPDDYIPDPKKGQGITPSVTARSQNL